MGLVVVFADAAEAAGYVTANLLLIGGLVAVIVAYRRRQQRGERAAGWLVASIVLGLLLLGAIANGAQG